MPSQIHPSGDMNLEDWISQLPDAILARILSLLTLKEAGRSSVLSHRWKYLWKLTTCLEFESPESLYKVRFGRSNERKKLVPYERSKFMTWVNQVLRLHESRSLDKFRVQFNLDASFSDSIDEWIKFIIPKRVKILEIDLYMFVTGKYYCLSQECYRSFKCKSNLSSIKCLTSISLSFVNVDGDLVEYLLSECPHLEKLSISYSQHLLKLKVDACLQLKYLQIVTCQFLRCIELSAPKLETFHYFGKKINFHIGSNPSLSELFIEGAGRAEVTCALVPFSSCLPQLETLSLGMMFEEKLQVIPPIPLLKNLKHLILDIWNFKDRSLISFTKLIASAPSLGKFTLQLGPHRPFDRCMQEPLSQLHQCLKEVEMLGFVGGFCDLELAKFLLKSAVNLEKMVIDPFHPSETAGPQPEIKGRAKQIQGKVDVLKAMLPAPRAEIIVVH